MTDYNVQFVLTARDAATQVLNQQRQTLQQMASSTTRSASDHRRATDMMADGNRQLSVSNDQAGWSFDGLKNALTGVVAGFSAYAIFQKGIELVNLGEEVHDVTVQFEAYAESLDNTTSLLPKLREGTLGGANDMELMAAASKLASLGLAKTDEDLTHFISGAFRLTGSAQEVDNLAMALTNMSYVRLDSFGLSADTARKRVAELKAEFQGMGDTEAFTRAVIEQMDEKLETVGDTLDEQVTSLDRFKVEWANFWNDLAITASDAANEILGYIESTGPQTFPTGGVPIVEDMDALRQQLSLLVDAMDIGVSLTVEEAIAQEKNLRGLSEEGRALLVQLAQANAEFSALGTDQPTVGSSNSLRDAMAIYHQQQERAYLTRTFTPQFAAFEREAETRAMQEQLEYSQQLYYNEQRRQDIMTTGVGLATDISQEYQTITDNAIEINGVEIVAPEQAERVREMADQYDYILERARAANENGVISDAELQHLETAAEQTRAMADELDRGAQALEDMSTSDFFGTESGGLYGQLSDEVIAAAQERGLTEDQINQLRDAFDVTSGRENDASLRWRDEIIPLIVETARTNSEDAAAAALQQYILETGTERFGEDQAMFLSGIDWMPTETEIEPFDTAMMNISSNMKSAAGDSEAMNQSLTVADIIAGRIVTKSGQVESHWGNLTSRVQKIQVEIDITRVNGGEFERWLATGMTNITQANGGVTPGQNPRMTE